MNDLYLDFGDDLSRELARIETANNGERELLSDETVYQSLPDGWTWDPDVHGPGRHVYMNDDTDEESTVHPARFYDPTGNESTCLPPGWDRRLDAWGNLFFVDHNTKSAFREDPRYNSNIDIATGLPTGWKAIKDHRGDIFFYRCRGRKIYGTSVAQTMNDKSVRGKQILRSEPKDGDDLSALDLHSRPSERDGAVKRVKPEQEDTKVKIRNMTEDEKRHYYRLFADAPKENELFLSFAEAMNHCLAFKVLPGIASQILLYSDTNQDRQFDCDEYATALHRIRISMEKEYSSTQIPPPTIQEKETYYSMFKQAKRQKELVLTLDEVLDLCKDYELPDTLVKGVWAAADANQDSFYNPTEFVEGMHQIMKQYERREGKCTSLPPPSRSTLAGSSFASSQPNTFLRKSHYCGSHNQ